MMNIFQYFLSNECLVFHNKVQRSIFQVPIYHCIIFFMFHQLQEVDKCYFLFFR